MLVKCFKPPKNVKNAYFNQRLVCAAPKRWSKYTTFLLFVLSEMPLLSMHKNDTNYYVFSFSVNSSSKHNYGPLRNVPFRIQIPAVAVKNDSCLSYRKWQLWWFHIFSTCICIDNNVCHRSTRPAKNENNNFFSSNSMSQRKYMLTLDSRSFPVLCEVSFLTRTLPNRLRNRAKELL